MTPPAPAGAITIDVEDWFHVENLRSAVPRSSWGRCELRVERNVDRILALMDERQVRGTWFVLGWVAARLPGLVRRIAEAGHEVASHGYGHALIPTISAAEFRCDAERSKKLLEDIVGAEVGGYRAPSFSITDEAVDELRNIGFRYDSSAFPVIAHDRYGKLRGIGSGDAIVEIRPGFYEVCVSCLSLGGHGIPWGGGGYFRLLPYPVFRAGIRRIAAQGRPYVFYLHPWEFDPGQPRPAGLRRGEAFRHYVNLERVEGRFARLLADFRWSSIRGLLDQRTRMPAKPPAHLPVAAMPTVGLSTPRA